jgi:hypothetical protein
MAIVRKCWYDRTQENQCWFSVGRMRWLQRNRGTRKLQLETKKGASPTATEGTDFFLCIQNRANFLEDAEVINGAFWTS